MKKRKGISIKLLGCSIILIVIIIGAIYYKEYKKNIQTKESGLMAITEKDFITSKGSILVNQKGEQVVLKGVNIGGWLIQENWMCPVKGEDREWANLNTIETLEKRGFTEEQIQTLYDTYYDNWFTEDDLDRIATTGCNMIRVPFWYRNFMKNTEGEWLSSDLDQITGFKRLDWIIEEAGKRGLYVVLDMHGCPGGQSMDHCCGTLGKNELYTTKEYQDTLIKLWVEIAKRYKGNPVVAAYDLMNEPQNNAGYTGQHAYDPWEQKSWEMSNELYNKLIQEVRKIDQEHVITVQGIWRITNLPDPKEYGWDNMMYQVHMYDDTNEFKRLLQEAKSICKQYGVALYVGEFSNKNGIQICAENAVSYSSWTYKASKAVGDWAWYTKRCEDVDPTQDSYEEIMKKWGKVLQTKESFSENIGFVKCIQIGASTKGDFFKTEDSQETINQNKYESEDANVNFGKKETNGNFSNSSYVGNMNTVHQISKVEDINDDWSNIPYIKYDVKVNKAGVYNIKIGYATQTPVVHIYYKCNDMQKEQWGKESIVSSGSWDKIKNKEITLPLKEGHNELWISGSTRGTSGDNWVNYDFIEVKLKEK